MNNIIERPEAKEKYMDGFLDRILRRFRLSIIQKYIKKGDQLLDVGSGIYFDVLKNFEKIISSGTGIDFAVQDKKINDKLNSFYADLEKGLPESIKQKRFDKITILACLEHIDNDLNLLRDCYNVLNEGGQILITVPSIYNKPLGEFLAYRLHLLEESSYRDHKRYYTPKKLHQDLEKVGFVVVKTKYWQLGMNTFAVGQKIVKPAN